ncbi:hypothetical protein M405DRAFT_840809 [Rhizopogon salebrosus TDB-379]|nr:hypothetical protein M405DRAFT_840809 [Rhizopogon salebrosus TDB-379]
MHEIPAEEEFCFLRELLDIDRTFVRGRGSQADISEAELLQAHEDFEILEAKCAQVFGDYFGAAVDPTNDGACSGIEGTSEPRSPSDTPEENERVHFCRWRDEHTKQICNERVAGRKALLSHLNIKHKVSGSEKHGILCRWVPLHSDSGKICGAPFQRRNVPRHFTKHLRLRSPCPYCSKDFSRSDQVPEHVRKEHSDQVQKASSM